MHAYERMITSVRVYALPSLQFVIAQINMSNYIVSKLIASGFSVRRCGSNIKGVW